MFTDASSRAYRAAVYTVNDTCTRSDLLMSKARVAPCREDRLTIPKLELTVSLIGARLIHYLTNLFKFQTIYLWSDSKVAISWITSDRDIKDVYVANRTAEIKTLINQHQVRVMYVAYLLKIIQLIISLEDVPQSSLSLVIGYTVLHGSSLVNSQNKLTLT